MADRYLDAKFVRDVLKGEPQDAAQVAQGLVDAMRSGRLPDAADAELINGFPLIDPMRDEIVPTDLPWLLDALRPDGDQQTALLVSLLRAHGESALIQERLRNLWGSATPYMRTQLFWRILDDPALPDVWHEQLLEFVLSAWDTFQGSGAKFMGPDSQMVLIRALERIGDPTFPPSKKWAYACSGAGASDCPAALRGFLVLCAGSDDPRMKRTGDLLLRKLFPG
ncbi:MAG: hypothetical protein ABW360_13690 [Phenylobacterium sp.]